VRLQGQRFRRRSGRAALLLRLDGKRYLRGVSMISFGVDRHIDMVAYKVARTP
jgi:hypothetical protein